MRNCIIKNENDIDLIDQVTLFYELYDDKAQLSKIPLPIDVNKSWAITDPKALEMIPIGSLTITSEASRSSEVTKETE